MEPTKIVAELREFLDTPGVTASDLARETGVSNARISYLRNGQRRDCASETAEKLREGMASLRAKASENKTEQK